MSDEQIVRVVIFDSGALVVVSHTGRLREWVLSHHITTHYAIPVLPGEDEEAFRRRKGWYDRKTGEEAPAELARHLTLAASMKRDEFLRDLRKKDFEQMYNDFPAIDPLERLGAADVEEE